MKEITLIENSTLSVRPAVRSLLKKQQNVLAIIQAKVSLNIILNMYLHNHIISMLGAPVAC